MSAFSTGAPSRVTWVPEFTSPAGPLTPDSVARIELDFQRRGADLPEYAGTGRAGTWLAPLYNPASHHLARLAGGIAAALHAGHDFNVAFTVTDSKGERDGDEGAQAYLYAPCMQLAQMLGAVEGFIPAVDSGNIWDDRWATSGMTGPTRERMGVAGAGTTTFTPPTPTGTFRIHSDVPQTITVNGTDVALTGDAGFETVDVTTSGPHTIVTNDPSSIILGFNPTYDGPRLRISRAARAGSYAEHWIPGANGPTGLWDGVMQAVQPDAIVMQIGTNSPETSVTPIRTLGDELAALDLPTLICTPGGLNRNAARDAVYAALWDVADEHDFPLLDLESVLGEGARAQELGLMDDTVHENRLGGAHVAAALREALR